MDFVTSVKTCFQKYFVFSGRARRSEFWWWILFTLVMVIPLTVIDVMLFSGVVEDIGPFETTFSLLTFIPTISVSARRLHDINKSGWWQVLPLAPAVVLGIGVGMQSINESTGSLIATGLGGILVFATIVLLIVWFATDSEKADNRFGVSPKYGGQATAFD